MSSRLSVARLGAPVARSTAGLLVLSAAVAPAADRGRPNIVVLMGDHVQAAVLEPGHPCRTPHLDRLAAEGVRFARCYTPNGMCSPARASLMTATYPSRHGVWDCTHTQRPRWVDVDPTLDHWAQRLTAAGYRTAYFGKWHLTQSTELKRYGWAEYETDACQTYRAARIPGTEVISRKEGYNDKLMAAVRRDEGPPPRHPAYDRGVEFIRRGAASGQPFCCFISTTEPGSCTPPKRFFDWYDVSQTPVSPTLHDDLRGKSEMLRRMQAAWRDVDENEWRFITACYYGQISFLDDQVGRVLRALDEAGCDDDTWIVYLSDHGRMLGAHGLVGLGLGLAYEEVYRVPLVIRPPAGVRLRSPRVVADRLVSLVDIGPTLLDLCGLPPLPEAQGRSLRPLLEGRADPSEWRDAYAEFFAQRFMFTQRIVWRDHWKYVFSPGGVDELYNLAEDRWEERNLAADPAHRATLVDMTKRMWRKMKAIGDQSLLNSHYSTLRTAPIGPLAVEP